MDSLASSFAGVALADDAVTNSYDDSTQRSGKSFRLFDLPPEIRRKILDYVFQVDKTLDIDLRVAKLLRMFTVSRQFHAEATQAFYGSNTFRLLPTHGSAAADRAAPLVRFFPRYCLAEITSMEFRLGPFWTNPPPCWRITDRLGLEGLVSLRVLQVFIELDPSHAIFNGFRSVRISYTQYTGSLFEEIVKRLPNLREIRIDTYPSVTRDSSPLMAKVIQIAVNASLIVSYGPGQQNSSATSSRRNSISYGLGMVPFYSSSPLHRKGTERERASVSA